MAPRWSARTATPGNHSRQSSPDAVKAELERVLASPNFQGAPRLCRFLRFIVEATLRGEGGSIKEYVLALEVFDCAPDFDPKTFSKVRVQAGNLRSRLAEYYKVAGRDDPLRIEIPKGSYVPTFIEPAECPTEIGAISEPDGQPAKEGELQPASEPEARPVDGMSVEPRARERPRSRWLLAAGLAGVIVAAIVGGYFWRNHQAPAVPVRRSVAVLGLDNLSGRGDKSWLSTALSEMLATELGAAALRPVAGEEVAHMRKDLDLPRTEGLSRETLSRVRRILGADFVVVGGYTVVPDSSANENTGGANGWRIRLDLRLEDTRTGEVVKSFAQTGTESGLFELVSLAGAQLTEALGLERQPASSLQALRASEPSTPEAVHYYYDGLSRMRAYDWIGAKASLERAVSSEPSFPLTHAALSQVWSALVYKERSREEAKTAFDLSPALSNDEKLLVEARYRETTGEWVKAEQLYQEMFRRFPDNIDYGLELAGAQGAQEKLASALATLNSLRRLPSPLGDDPRIDLRESMAYEQLPKHQEAVRAATQAEQKSRLRGSRGQLAEARLGEAAAWTALGNLDQAKQAALETRQICAGLGDEICVARAFARLGILEIGSSMVEAEKQFQQSYEIAQRAGSYYAANALSNLGGLRAMEGDCKGAEQALAGASKGADEAGDTAFLLRVTINRSAALIQAGQLRAAEGMCRRASAVMANGDNKMYLAENLVNLARVLELQGDLAGAMKSRQEFLAFARGSGSVDIWKALAEVAHTLFVRGDVRAARQMLDQAQAEARKVGYQDLQAEYIDDFVGLALEERRAGEGEILARQAEERSKARSRLDDAARACSALAKCLLAEGRVAEAKSAIDRSAQHLEGVCAAGTASEDTITGARIQAATGSYRDAENVAAALRSLENVLAGIRRTNFAGVRFEARLARGEIQILAGRGAKARAELTSLAKEAQEKGYGLVAHRSTQLLKTAQAAE